MKFRKLLNLLRNSKGLFKNMWNIDNRMPIISSDSNWRLTTSDSKTEKDERKEVRPIDIFEEIIGEKPIININNLDGQIKLVKERMSDLKKHLRNVTLNQEQTALNYLEARKKYAKHKEKFMWGITNQDLIDKLCKKYKVRIAGIEGFYRNIPKEGVDEIKKFGEAFEKVTKCDPIFKVIIDDGGKEDKKDPILLAASPFGNWFYILGAWDKEVEIVDDLIYKGK